MIKVISRPPDSNSFSYLAGEIFQPVLPEITKSEYLQMLSKYEKVIISELKDKPRLLRKWKSKLQVERLMTLNG